METFTSSREEIRKVLLQLIRDGIVAVKADVRRNGAPCFVAVEFATTEDFAFTEKWLKAPHFDVIH